MQLHHPEREYIDQKWDSNNSIDVNPGVEEKDKNSIFIKNKTGKDEKCTKVNFFFQIIQANYEYNNCLDQNTIFITLKTP